MLENIEIIINGKHVDLLQLLQSIESIQVQEPTTKENAEEHVNIEDIPKEYRDSGSLWRSVSEYLDARVSMPAKLDSSVIVDLDDKLAKRIDFINKYRKTCEVQHWLKFRAPKRYEKIKADHEENLKIFTILTSVVQYYEKVQNL